MKTTRLAITLLSVFGVFPLEGCSVSRWLPVAPGANEMAVDCGWGGIVQAWIDEDEDGIWDDGESPLASVPFFVDDPRNNLTKVADYSMSNLQGEARLSVWLPGCPEVVFEIYPEVPSGFRLTTPDRVVVSQAATGALEKGAFLFGFALLPGVPTPTPRPQVPMTCTQYSLVGEHEYGLVKYLVVAKDGTVWGTTLRGIFHYDWGENIWETYGESSLPNTNISAMNVAQDGKL